MEQNDVKFKGKNNPKIKSLVDDEVLKLLHKIVWFPASPVTLKSLFNEYEEIVNFSPL